MRNAFYAFCSFLLIFGILFISIAELETDTKVKANKYAQQLEDSLGYSSDLAYHVAYSQYGLEYQSSQTDGEYEEAHVVEVINCFRDYSTDRFNAQYTLANNKLVSKYSLDRTEVLYLANSFTSYLIQSGWSEEEAKHLAYVDFRLVEKDSFYDAICLKK